MLNKVHNSTKYTNIPDDSLDTRIPLFSDDAFKLGIVYEAKYIGSMDVARPQNRMEIVSAMRRIRFEFKAKAVKKERIYFKISTEGVFVNLRTRKKTPMKLRLSQSFNLINGVPSEHCASASSTGLLLMQHPIYRIFYVSHDSQDLKIFSYIARDSKSTTFKCNVFKALRKMEAMKIVRTVGQAFDVCHRFNQKNEDGKDSPDLNASVINSQETSKSEIEKEIQTPTPKVMTTSQSAQPIRSADLIKIEDDAQSDSQSESLSTLDDLLTQSSKKKSGKRTVSNSVSEPSIKSHSNGLSEEKRLTFDSFLSSYLFLNYFISKQLSELNSNFSQEISKSNKSQIPFLNNIFDQNELYSPNMTPKISTAKLELLKGQLEEEIKFRSKCQSQIEVLACQNKLLSSFIKRTFEEIRHNECESCMLRLSSLDIYSGFPKSTEQRHYSMSGNDLSKLYDGNTKIPESSTTSSINTENFFKNFHSELKTFEQNNVLMDQSNKDIRFDELDFYRKLDDSINRNFYKIATWSPHYNEDYQLDFKKQRNSDNPSQCTSETSIAISQDESNQTSDKTWEFLKQ